MSNTESDSDEEYEVNSLGDAFKVLSVNAKEYYLGSSIPEFDSGPESSLHFYRDWVSQNRPVIFRNAITDWPAMSKWQTNEYFRNKIGDFKVTVSATPTGYADAVVLTSNDGSDDNGDDAAKFLMPHEDEVTMNRFLDIIEDPSSSRGIHYIQKQNSNLTDEFRSLIDDTRELDWAKEAFGKSPDAINFWMGDGRAVTSTHKDPYENIYCVVRGFKDFILFPPTDLPWLKYRTCAQAKYSRTPSGDFEVTDLPDWPKIPWIVVDPLSPDLEKFPEYSNATPFHLRLNAGDVLFLPSFWFHHLRQSHGCVAVNFWYDMDYDCKWNYFNFLSNVVKLSKGSE